MMMVSRMRATRRFSDPCGFVWRGHPLPSRGFDTGWFGSVAMGHNRPWPSNEGISPGRGHEGAEAIASRRRGNTISHPGAYTLI